MNGLALVLVGSPNTGKTTLFNWLTGARFRTVNYAGSTVETFAGKTLSVYGEPVEVIDTPGVYSLDPSAPDEQATFDILKGLSPSSVLVAVVDATQLYRQLYLVRQIQAAGLPFVLAVTMADLAERLGRPVNLAELSQQVGVPVVSVDGRLGGGVKELVAAARARVPTGQGSRTPEEALKSSINWDHSRIEREMKVAEGWAEKALSSPKSRHVIPEDLRQLDRILLHPVWGIVCFLAVMLSLFSSIFWLSAPIMDAVDQGFSFLASQVSQFFGAGLVSDFLADGVINGVGAVLIFVPQIFILFLGFNLLEDSGYLARAATLVDRPLQAVGLSGRAFVPILSGFACAVPGVLAARNLRSPRERWIAIMIIPLMTCSARLPVYALLLGLLFQGEAPWKAGLALTGLYVAGLILGLFASAVLSRFLKSTKDAPFLMELPMYRRPKIFFTLKMAARRSSSYIKKAGPTIFVFVLLLWAGTHLPYRAGDSPAVQLEHSYVGRVGHWIEPVFEPLQLDWRVGLGILSAFVAREVFVSSMAVIFSITDDDETSLQKSLLSSLKSAVKPNGQPLFTTASILALIVFFMISLQCLSTTGVTWRELGSWKAAALQLAAYNILGYFAAWSVAQITFWI